MRTTVALVSFSDSGGGAAAAARRLHAALVHAEFDARLLVAVKRMNGSAATELYSGWDSLAGRVRNKLAHSMLARLGNREPSSIALFPSGVGRRLARVAADVLHLHWVCGEMLSIAEIGRISTPVVWTLHDSWVFSGIRHLPAAPLAPPMRGALARVDRWTLARKRRHWRRPMTLVCPSEWLAAIARKSEITGDWPIRVIPNPLDTTLWSPIDRRAARAALGVPPDARVVMFGAAGGAADANKGADLLREALDRLRASGTPKLELLVAGPETERQDWGLPTHRLGHVDDEQRLVRAYAAADVVVVPSRSENLPYAAMEAQACGTPVVGFRVGGMPETVCDGRSGLLAEPFDAARLAELARTVLEDAHAAQSFRVAAREWSVRRFDARTIAAAYADLYESVRER